MLGLYLVAKAPPFSSALLFQSARAVETELAARTISQESTPAYLPISVIRLNNGSEFEELKRSVEQKENKQKSQLSQFMLLHTNVKCQGRDLFLFHYKRTEVTGRSKISRGNSNPTALRKDEFWTEFYIFDDQHRAISLVVEPIPSVMGIESGIAEADCPSLLGKIYEITKNKKQLEHWVSIKFSSAKGVYEISKAVYPKEVN